MFVHLKWQENNLSFFYYCQYSYCAGDHLQESKKGLIKLTNMKNRLIKLIGIILKNQTNKIISQQALHYCSKFKLTENNCRNYLI